MGKKSTGNAVKTVLIADDEVPLRHLVVASLEGMGLRLLEAAHGEEALAKAKAERPDLILLDWAMPRMSGIEVLDAIRRETQDVPVVMLTAHAQVADRMEAYRHGVTSFVVKPFSPARLASLVERLLAGTPPPEDEP